MASDNDFIVMGVDPGLMTGVCSSTSAETRRTLFS